MTIDEYVRNHNSIHYCEAIILPNGDVEDAVPSHTLKLIEVSRKPRNDINRLMPIDASPLEWLVCFTGCVAVWYDFFKYHALTEEQKASLKILVDNGIVQNGITGKYTNEYAKCRYLASLRNGLKPEPPEEHYGFFQIQKDINKLAVG